MTEHIFIQNFQDNVCSRQNSAIPYLLCVETIFTELLKAGDLLVQVEPMKTRGNFRFPRYKLSILFLPVTFFLIPEQFPDNERRVYFQKKFNQVFNLICECLDFEKSESQQALNTALKLLAAEGKFFSEGQQHQAQEKNFPIVHLNQILSKLLSWEKQNKNLITKLSEFAIYEDFLYFAWKLMLKNLTPTKMNHPNPIFIENYLDFLNVILKNPNSSHQQEETPEFLCKTVKMEEPVTRKNINKIWNFIVQWEHNETTHRQLLVLLLEKIITHLEKPILLTDFLMDSLDAGGPISLLALQGVFLLIHRFNLSYPNIYEKLYAMFEPEIFHMKFKPRLFYLADIFLTST